MLLTKIIYHSVCAFMGACVKIAEQNKSFNNKSSLCSCAQDNMPGALRKDNLD